MAAKGKIVIQIQKPSREHYKKQQRDNLTHINSKDRQTAQTSLRNIKNAAIFFNKSAMSTLLEMCLCASKFLTLMAMGLTPK